MIEIINEKRIIEILSKSRDPTNSFINAVLEKGLQKKGLTLDEVAILVNTVEEEQIEKIFKTAAKIKYEIYGERLVLFAPLYISDYCVNDCKYCNFHVSNKGLLRKKLSMDDIANETKCLIDMGHKRVLVEFGEDPYNIPIDYVCDAIKTIYSVKSKNGNIRRINVNIAATTTENYRRLKRLGIGTYQLFQETYHRATYEGLHGGPKADYERQITAHVRAFEGGIDDLGIGVLFGLYDWRFEVMALIAHAQWMDKNLGVGPHTISVPRFCSAPSVEFKPEFVVSDKDFLKLIAILRIAVPYTGMILSTRERPDLRTKAFKLGISQASAASITAPGGYSSHHLGVPSDGSQFEIHDNRPLNEVVEALIAEGLVPSFCTACYRKGRTGEAFMELAKEGDIHKFCKPNALMTFAEYLEDYADSELKKKGYEMINHCVEQICCEAIKEETKKRLIEICRGKRDLYF